MDAEEQFNFYNNDWGYGPGWYREGWFREADNKTQESNSTIYSGHLAVDIYDARNHCLVWRGVVAVAKTLDPTATPGMQEKSLNKSLAKLLRKYPPSLYSVIDLKQ